MEGVEEEAGSFGVQVVRRDAVDDLADGLLDGGAVFGEGQGEGGFGGGFVEDVPREGVGRGSAGGLVEVAEGFGSQGSAAAAVACGVDVAALVGFSGSAGVGVHVCVPPRVFWSKICSIKDLGLDLLALV